MGCFFLAVDFNSNNAGAIPSTASGPPPLTKGRQIQSASLPKLNLKCAKYRNLHHRKTMRPIAPSPMVGEGGPTAKRLVVGVRRLSLKQSKIKNRRVSPPFPVQMLLPSPPKSVMFALRRVKLFHSEVCLTASDVRLAAKE